MIRKRTLISVIFTLVVAPLVAVLGLRAHTAVAQTPSLSPPPSYDWDDTVPGTQGPTSPLLAGAERRQFRAFVVQIPVLVPLSDLQAALPPGFIAIANPAGSSTAQVSLSFNAMQRLTQAATGRTASGSALTLTTAVMNTNIVPNRQETMFLAYEASTQELVDSQNSLYGDGTARLAKLTIQITDEGGRFSVKGTATDDGIGLSVQAEATCPGPIANRVKNDPNAGYNRYLVSNRSYIGSQVTDQLVVPQAMANSKVDAGGGKLQVPVAGGLTRSLAISGIGASTTFFQNREQFFKIE